MVLTIESIVQVGLTSFSTVEERSYSSFEWAFFSLNLSMPIMAWWTLFSHYPLLRTQNMPIDQSSSTSSKQQTKWNGSFGQYCGGWISRYGSEDLFVLYFTVAVGVLLVLKQLVGDCESLNGGEVKADMTKDYERSNASEWRYMLANIAHDLKTPLAAFTNGCDLLKIICSDIEKAIPCCCHQDGMCERHIRSQTTAAEGTIDSIRNTCTYMTMIINRCLDYTKASHGVKLAAHMETISFIECLQSPVACVLDMLSSNSIALLPLPEDMAVFICTDKQWLTENILCLIANGIKYSMGGPVTVRVCLEDRKSEDNELSSSGMTNEDHYLRTITASTYNNVDLGCKEDDISSSEPFDRYVRIEVEDHGIGVAADIRSSLFEPFCSKQRQAGGTGLGLYSLARRMEALKGYCGVRDRYDGETGSVFWFAFPYFPRNPPLAQSSSPVILQNILTTPSMVVSSSSVRKIIEGGVGNMMNSRGPLMPPSPKATSVAVNPSPVSTTLPPKPSRSSSLNSSCLAELACIPRRNSFDDIKSLNVLIVDDSLPVLKMTRKVLEKDGHTVETAQNGAEAVEKWIQQEASGNDHFDVILMDIQMPIMDGFEATKKIRSIELDRFHKASTAGLKVTPVPLSSNDYQSTIPQDHKSSSPSSLSSSPPLFPRLSQPIGHENIASSPSHHNANSSTISAICTSASSSSFSAVTHKPPFVSQQSSLSQWNRSIDRTLTSEDVNLTDIMHTKDDNNNNNDNSYYDNDNSQCSTHDIHRRPHHQVIIGCSANSDDITVQDAYLAGVTSFLPKPFNLEKFKDIVAFHAR
eukprot:scaffold1187_cov181-Ochromonas_danica.AAC.17